jgi:hypothetical protein
MESLPAGFGDYVADLSQVVHPTLEVQITVEAIRDLAPADKRRFATIGIPREKLAAALGADLRERHGPKTPYGLRVVRRND